MPEPTQQISIRIPTALLQEIETIAQDANIPRSQAIVDALHRGLGRVTQAESQAESRANHDGAIEVLRLELAEAIERIGRLERQANAQPRPTVSAQPRPALSDGQTFTTRELADRLGIDRSNASRDLKKRGFERVGKRGKSILWAEVKPQKNEI
jgi:hypothetical protein